MRAIGINDFDDADDEWDADFNAIVDHLVGNIRYSISSVDPLTGQVEQLDDFTAERIQSFLAYVDHLDLVINVAGTRTIRFTRGHKIFWLAGFARHDIESLPFALEPTQNARIGELFEYENMMVPRHFQWPEIRRKRTRYRLSAVAGRGLSRRSHAKPDEAGRQSAPERLPAGVDAPGYSGPRALIYARR
ncbi:MAG: hypothetical protein KJ579_09020 [Verrucomicrobia bacterium]|nr:hypothetical protein [Verrucomicrobiota bacterium]